MRPITLMGLQTGFGEVRGDPDMQAIAAINCQVCRISLNRSDAAFTPLTDREADAVISEVRNAKMTPYVIVRSHTQVRQVPKGIPIELGNEPEDPKFGWPGSTYVDEITPTVKACKGRHDLYVGVVANLRMTNRFEAPAGVAFLQQIPWKTLPKTVGCSHHWYPDDARPHDSHIQSMRVPYLGEVFGVGRRWTRDEDIARLRAIVGETRPLAMSESGWWDHPAIVDEKTGAVISARTEDEVAAWYAVERAFWSKHGYDFAIAYQVDSGQPPADPSQWGPGHGYGARRYHPPEEGVNTDWKPWVREWFGTADEGAAA